MIISFEGIDGSGKSTQAKHLMARLSEAAHKVLYVREPGGTQISESIRELLLNPEVKMNPFTEMLLFSAARAELVREKIKPFHERGGIVICDRFFDSTVAYQGGGRQVADSDWLDAFQREVVDGLIPERTYLVRVSVEEASKRLAHRFKSQKAADRLEMAGAAFFHRVSKEYDRLAERDPERFRIIDGSASEAEVAEEIWEDINQLLIR